MPTYAIRPETPADAPAVRRVHELAFGQPDEADLVARLREQAEAYLALVAHEEEALVGHIAFTRVTLEPAVPALRAFGLGPMGVRPEHQRQGAGAALVQAGLAVCREAGGDAVVVLGHPAYYPRFGFVPASRFGLRCTYGVPDEVFMAFPLTPGALDGISGTVHYHPAFGA